MKQFYFKAFVMVGAPAKGGEKSAASSKGPLKMHQAGLDPNSDMAITLVKELHAASEICELAGSYVHAAHSYSCQSREDCMKAAREEALGAVTFAKRVFEATGIVFPVISVGSTPSTAFDLTTTDQNKEPFEFPTVEGIAPSTPSSGEHEQEVSSTSSLKRRKITFRVNEIHAGNYLVFDSMQVDIGSCNTEDIACVVRAQVVSNYAERGALLILC